MIHGFVEITKNGRHLSQKRGFMAVSQDKTEIGRVPLDDIAALIITARQTTLSTALIAALMDRKATIVTCGQNFVPSGMTWPCSAHHSAAGTLHIQINAPKPRQKRLWQQIIVAKIRAQKTALTRAAPDITVEKNLDILARQVKSGDPDNREAQAARLYWPAMMGPDFRRNQSLGGINAALNYGYTVLRAATIRALCGAGLNPALGLHHGTAVNSFALADDIMEPFRPLIDIAVKSLGDDAETDLTPDTKRALAGTLDQPMLLDGQNRPLHQALAVCAQSLIRCLAGEDKTLAIATSPDTPLGV